MNVYHLYECAPVTLLAHCTFNSNINRVWETEEGEARTGKAERFWCHSLRGWVAMPVISNNWAPESFQCANLLAFCLLIASVQCIPLWCRQPPKNESDLSDKKAVIGTAMTTKKATRAKRSHSVMQRKSMMLHIYKSLFGFKNGALWLIKELESPKMHDFSETNITL